MSAWYRLTNTEEIPTPALVLYPDLIRDNIHRMIQIARGPERLRPHLKTHKLGEIVQLQLDAGITKFKCATIAEAEMAATAGAKDVLLAYPMVGPNAARLLELTIRFPGTHFSCVADDASSVLALAAVFQSAGRSIEVLLDVDCGQRRTGVTPGSSWVMDLYGLLASTPGLIAGGLHIYDGHITEPDLNQRTALCEAAFAPIAEFRRDLAAADFPVPRIVAGGTPTFPVHARNEAFECSPGTCVLWDFGYGLRYRDLDFRYSALLLTRVVSKPGANLLCLDLGYKAVASENPAPRVQFLNLPATNAVAHSEEHLVIETNLANDFAVGDCLYGVPRHICPTVALFSEAVVARNGRASSTWRITARERQITI